MTGIFAPTLAAAIHTFLLRFALMFVNREWAENLVQDLMVKALRGRIRIRHGRAQPVLYKAVRNQVNTDWTRQKHRDALVPMRRLESPHEASTSIDFVSVIMTKDALRTLLALDPQSCEELVRYQEERRRIPTTNRHRTAVCRKRQQLRQRLEEALV